MLVSGAQKSDSYTFIQFTFIYYIIYTYVYILYVYLYIYSYTYTCIWASQVARGKNKICLPMQETQEMQVQSLGWEDPLKEEMATLSSILAWRNPRTEDPGGQQPMASLRAG